MIRIWAGSLLHPQERLLPGLGARLGRVPRVAAAVLTSLRRLPTRRLRAAAYAHVAQPLIRRMDAELCVHAVGGVRMMADVSTPMGRTLAASGLWEADAAKVEVIRAALRGGDVFVDAGANVGYYTALAARIVGRAGHVYALEPAPETYLQLRRNLRINGFDERVTALAAAAGAAEGRATLYGPAGGHDITSSLRAPRKGGLETEVQVHPLHALIRAEHLDRLRFVKIDVEGHEDDALTGLEPLLERGARPTLLVELHPRRNEAGPAFVSDFCRRWGFRAHWVATADERLAPVDLRLELRDLGMPPPFDAIREKPYEVLLESF